MDALRIRPGGRQALGLAGLAVLLACNAAAATETGAGHRTMGFVMANFDMAMTPAGPQSCPDGYTIGSMESFLRNLARGERDFWSRPEQVEHLHFLTNKGPGEVDLCLQPGLGHDPGMRTVQGGGPALGLDLDGIDGRRAAPAAPGTCAQDDFTGADGARGVDNQLYRVLGCVPGFQPGQQVQSTFIQDLSVGEHTYLIELSGVDDLRNDPEVDVALLVSPNVPPLAGVSQNAALDAGVRLMPNASLDVDPEPKFQNRLRGRIVNGRLTTDPGAVLLPIRKPKDQSADLGGLNSGPAVEAFDASQPGYRFFIDPAESRARQQAVPAADQARAADAMNAMLSGDTRKRRAPGVKIEQPVYRLSQARLEAELKEDGSLSGVLAGYYDIRSFFEMHGNGVTAAANHFHCSAAHFAMYRFADGDFDPATGRCNSLSTAFKVEAVPAFLVRPEEAEAAKRLVVADRSAPAATPEPASMVGGWLRKLGW